MDAQQAAVITAAIEQQRLEEAQARRAALEQQEQQEREQNKEESEALQRPRVRPEKSFAVDPELKVGMGVLPDVSGPKVVRPDATPTDLAVGKSQCTRCKKEYAVIDGKVFKLCPHCRDLQRQRSKRWQQKTKLKEGTCRRCGISIPEDQAKYVLCPPCRLMMRNRKTKRFEAGKCIHCASPNDSSEYKVCTRCRNNDKMRRKQMEEANRCNRCGESLENEAAGRKVCTTCRSRKKSVAKANASAAAAAAVASSQGLVNFARPSGQQPTGPVTHANAPRLPPPPPGPATGGITHFEQIQYAAQQAQRQQSHVVTKIEPGTDEKQAAQLENNLFAAQQQTH